MEKKKWIQDAVKHKGALRKEAKREHLIKGDEKLSMADLKKLEKKGGKTAKRAYLAETLRGFGDGGQILDWAEGNAEKLVQKYLDAEPNEVFSQKELKNKGDYYIGTESSGDGETVFIDVYFGDEFEKHDNNLEKNYEYFTRFAEDISDNMNYEVSVMTNSDDQTIMFQFTDWFPEESEEPEDYAKGGKVLDLKDVYYELRSKVGRLEINEETKENINCDIRDWGNWEHDYEDYERDEEDFEDDDSMILSESSAQKMQKIVEEIRTKYPTASIRWSTSEKNYIDFQISRKMAKGGINETEEVKNFKSNLLKKYGNGGDYQVYFAPSGASSDEINKAVDLYLDLFSENDKVDINGQIYQWEGGKKRIDESIVTDIMLYNRGKNNFAELYYGDVVKRAILKQKGMAKGGELEDDTFVMLFKGYGFVEKRGSYGTRTFYNKQHNAYIYYDPKYRSISGYVGGGEGNDEVIPYSVEAVLDFFIEHDISESDATPLGAGGMTTGRWYPDKTGEEYRFIGEDGTGRYLFNDGQKVIIKPLEDFEEAPKEKKLFKFFRMGGALKEDFLEDVAEMHNEIKEITLKDGSKITHDELMEAHQFLEPDETQEYYASMQYGKGGTFDSKVQSISKKLVGKPVPKQYRKEYGSRYDKEDAQEAARRIVGNMRKLYGE